jgi:hypothetical protein
MLYLTHLASKVTGIPITSPDLPDGKKRAVKKGLDIAVVEVVDVPFGSLPGDFGIQPVESKSVPPKDVADEAAADTVLKAMGGEVAAAVLVPDLEVTGKDAPVVVAGEETLKVSGKEAAADMGLKVTGGEVVASVLVLDLQLTANDTTVVVPGEEALNATRTEALTATAEEEKMTGDWL